METVYVCIGSFVTNGTLPSFHGFRCGYKKDLSLTRVGCAGLQLSRQIA